MLETIRFSAKQTATKLVDSYTADELSAKAKLRNISFEDKHAAKHLLQKQLEEEDYILHVSDIQLWFKKRIDQLYNRLLFVVETSVATEMKQVKNQFDPSNLALYIVMIIVREKIPYKFQISQNGKVSLLLLSIGHKSNIKSRKKSEK